MNPATGQPFIGCLNCRHLDWRRMTRCAAYPDGIPLPILGGDVAHDRPLPGDHGIQFAPMSATALPALDNLETEQDTSPSRARRAG